MRALNTVQRVLMVLLLIPVAAVSFNVLLRALGAQRSNPIVSTVRSTANVFILDPFTDVFPKQSYLQDGMVAVVGYGLIALLIVGIFRLLRSLLALRPARPAPPPASAPTKTASSEPAPTAPTSSGGEPTAAKPDDTQPAARPTGSGSDTTG